MASIPLTRGPWRPHEGHPRVMAPRGADIPMRLQQQQQQRMQVRSALTHAQDNQLPESLQQQLLQHGKAPPYRQRVVAWQATDSSTEDEDTAIYSSEARIEVTAKCRPKEEVFQALKDAIKAQPKLSAKHRELLENTIKGLISDRRVSYYIICAMRAVLSAAGGAWTAAKERSAAPSLCIAAAAAAADLTMAGVSPKEAAAKAAETAVSKGIGAVRNLTLQHKAEQQRQQHAAAAAAALRRAQAAAAALDDSSDDADDDSDTDDSVPANEAKAPNPLAPDSAAAASHGVHLPQQLIETATSEGVLRHAAYFDKRLEFFLFLLIDEMRNLARHTWKLVEEKLLPAAESQEAKVAFLQLSADVARYTSQVVVDPAEVEKLRRQSLKIYHTALEIFEDLPKTGEDEEEILLSTKMGLVLNYSVLLHDEPDGVQQAIKVSSTQFREAVDNVVQIT